jgi:hypothetical protein
MADVARAGYIQKQANYKSSKLYTYAFPILILVPLLILLIFIFIVPVENAIDSTRSLLSLNQLKTVKSAVGNLDMFKFRNPLRQGVMS